MPKLTAQQAYGPSPRGPARYGFAEPGQPPRLSESERSKSTQHLQQERLNHGARWGHRDQPFSDGELAKLESSHIENRCRLGWHSDRSHMNANDRTRLDPFEGYARLGMLEERDVGSKTARAAIEKDRSEGRRRLGWMAVRSSMTAQERSAAHGVVNHRASGLGFVSQFGGDRGITSKVERNRIGAGREEERSRFGWASEPAATDSTKRRHEASIRKHANEKAVVSQLRLYADEPRSEPSPPQREFVRTLMDEGRARLGMIMERSPSSGPLQGLDENRCRLGFLEERTFQSKADRAQMVAKSADNYARLGMCEERDAPTAAARHQAANYAANNVARMGMAFEGARVFSPAVRQRAVAARREDRHRMGQQSSRDTEAVRLEGKGRALTPRRAFHSSSWHWGDVIGNATTRIQV